VLMTGWVLVWVLWLAEHLHCREKASIFDVSHMGQIK
jgi:glycine cleavage system aminomethyltransferase T